MISASCSVTKTKQKKLRARSGAIVKIATYDQWRKAKIELLQALCQEDEQPVSVDCPKCDGSGEITDYGEITGQEFEATCNQCEGEGKVDSSEIKDEDFKKETHYFAYLDELKSDLFALAVWTGKPVDQVLFEAGFRVWSDIETKRLNSHLDDTKQNNIH